IYTVYYIDNADRQSSGISDPGTSSDFAVTAPVQVERTNLIVANSFYIGFETITNAGDAISFDENHAKLLTYNSGAYSYYNHGTGTSYDNLLSYNITLLQDVTKRMLYMAQTDEVVVANGTVLLEIDSTHIHDITSKLCTTQANYSVYDATNATATDDGYDAEDFAVDPFPYNYYYNTSVFDSHPVAFASSPTKSGKLNLVYEVAPSEIELRATPAYALNNDNRVVALGITIDTSTLKPQPVELKDVIIATIKPNFADSEKFAITIDDASVAKYENGVITPVAPGVTKLRYTSILDKNISGSIDLVLYYAPNTFEMYDMNGYNITDDMNVVKGYITNVISNVYATYTYVLDKETKTKTYTNEINGVRIYSTDSNLDKVLFNNTQFEPGVEYNLDSSFIAVKGLEKGQVVAEFTPYVKVGDYTIYFEYQAKSISFNVVLGNFELTTPTNVTINPTSTVQFAISVRTDNVDEEHDENSLSIANVRTSTPSYAQDVNAEPTHNQVVYTVFKGLSVADIHSDQNQSTLFDNLIDIVHVSSNNEHTEDDQYIRSFNFEANINPNCYDMITSTIVYRVRVQMLASDGQVITSYFNITVIPQELSSVILTNYARLYYDDGRNVSSNTEIQNDAISMYKYSSDTLVPGFSALMQIDLNPWYGMFDYIDVTCESSGIVFDQMMENENLGEYSTMVSFPNYALIPNGIRLTQKASHTLGADGFDFDGRMFVRINASSSLMNGYQTVVVKCYLNDGTLVFTQSKSLLVVEAPRIVLTTMGGNENDNNKSGVIATGTSVQFNAKFYGNPDYWKVTSIAGLSIVEGTNTFRHTLPDGITYQSLTNACGEEIIITVIAEKTISGIKFTTEDTIRYRIVKFVVDNIRIERVENGYFNGWFNQIYPLHTKLDVTYYKDELQSTFGQEVLEEV
ncbi:MAG: hypothetical protein IK070_00375, partial [Clostridia bacterium]|nr:hypothetical protein [Clostridia bacterium]